MSDTDIFIDNNALHLVERIVMRRIDIFISKYSPWDNRTDRRILISHDEILHTGRLCRENIPCSFEPESILHISGRVVFRYVHRIEVQILSRDFHRFMYIESHSSERIFDFLTYESDRVKRSFFSLKWSRRIFPFARKSSCDIGSLDRFALVVECQSDRITDFIGSLSDRSFLFIREIFESLEYHSEFSGFSEDRIFVLDKRLFCGNIRKSGECAGFEGVEKREHGIIS